MKLTLVRAIPLVLVLDVVLFLISGIAPFKNAEHGTDYVISEVDWLGFLLGALALLVLVATAVYRAASRRRAEAAGL